MATTTDARLLKSTKFPPEFNSKVDMQKVNLQVMKKWIAGKISEILGNEDDVVIELCFNLIEGSRYPDIKSLQIQLTGFLDKDTPSFCKELWKLLLSAQGNAQGVPKELLEAKKLELMQEKMEADKAAEAARQRNDEFQQRDRAIGEIKERERRERGGRRGDRGGHRGDRAFDRRDRDDLQRGVARSRSPDPRFRDIRDSRRPDVYNPRGRTAARGSREAWRQRRRDSPSPERKGSDLHRRGSSRSPSAASRRPSPRRRDPRKRSRSPRASTYRPGRDSRGRDERRRSSRSKSSERRSPAAKRRRYSSSRSRSVRRRRSRSSSASSSRSYGSSRSRSLSASRSPSRSISRSRSRPSDSRSRSRSGSGSRSRSRSKSRSVSRGPRRGARNGGRRRRNSSSPRSLSASRKGRRSSSERSRSNRAPSKQRPRRKGSSERSRSPSQSRRKPADVSEAK